MYFKRYIRINISVIKLVVVLLAILFALETDAISSHKITGRIVYTFSEKNGNKDNIMVFNGDTGKSEQLTSTGGNLWPKWSSDGEKIYFGSASGYRYHQVFVMDADGKNVERLTHSHYKIIDEDVNELIAEAKKGKNLDEHIKIILDILYDILQSPDGGYLATYNLSKTSLLDTSSSTSMTFDYRGGKPSWSKDGNKLAFSTVIGNGMNFNNLIVIYNVQDRKFEEVTIEIERIMREIENEGKKFAPDAYFICGGNISWSPDSDKIVVPCRDVDDMDDPNAWLYILDVQTGKMTKLLRGNMPDWH
jgi:Tol biopolymer transport system component